MSVTYTLYHASSMSSTYIIAIFDLFSVPFTLKTIDLDFDRNNGIIFGGKDAEVLYDELNNVSPLAQFPTLVVDDGKDKFVLTEMAAIAFYLHDKYAANTPWSTASLTSAQLAMYYRLMLFIPGNIYPWVTMEDFPRRFIKVPRSSMTPADEVYGWAKEQGSENLKRMFIILEGLLKGNVYSLYAVGSTQPTLADVYIALVSHYAPRPRPSWLQEVCPRVYANCRKTLEHPVIRKVFLTQDFECHLAVEESGHRKKQ